jgi:hypothetical protein
VLAGVLERPGGAYVRAALADNLVTAHERRPLPDGLQRRLFAVAAAHVLTCPPLGGDPTDPCVPSWPWDRGGLDVQMARIAVGVDVERLGAFAELRDMVTRHPHTTSQAVLVREMLWRHEASRDRVALLGELVAHGAPDAQGWALDSLVYQRPLALPREICAILVGGMQSATPGVALHAAIRVAAEPACGADRGRALDDIEARVAKGPLPQAPITYLCGLDLLEADRARPHAVLRSIALDAAQPFAVREDAMGIVHFCHGAGWEGLHAALLRDPDAAVRTAADKVDRMQRIDVGY